MSRMFAAVYCDTSVNFPYPDSIEYVGSMTDDNVENLKKTLDAFRATMGLEPPVKVIVGKSETIVRGFFAVEAENNDEDDQYYAIDVEYVYDWQSPMMTRLRPFDNEDYDCDDDNFVCEKYIKNHIDSIHIDEATKVDEPSKDVAYILVKSAYRTFNDDVMQQLSIKKISANRSDLEAEVYNDFDRIKKVNSQSRVFRSESDFTAGVWVYGLKNAATELIVTYRIIKAIENEIIVSQYVSDPTKIVAACDYDAKTPTKIYERPFKTSININEIAQGVRDLLGGDINDSDVKAILDCFGFEIDGQFIPLTAKPDGEEQTGMSSDEFKSKYSGILK